MSHCIHGFLFFFHWTENQVEGSLIRERVRIKDSWQRCLRGFIPWVEDRWKESLPERIGPKEERKIEKTGLGSDGSLHLDR